MSKDKIADYDGATAGNNTDIGGISIDEGMLPSTVNNSMRELTRQLGAFADGTDGIDVLNLHDDDASASIKIQAPATVTTTTTFTLPDGDGTSGYALVTNGSGQLSWASAAGIGNVVEDTTPQLGGNLDLNSNNITGTGNIDVTGTVTADGIDVQGDGTISGGSRLTISDIADVNNDGIRLDDSTTGRFNNLTQDSSGNFKIQHWTGSAWQNNLTVTTGGSVGIGTASPEDFGGGYTTLEVAGSSTANGGVFKTATSDSAGTGTAGTEMLMYSNNGGGVITVTSSDPLLFQTAGAERMRLTSAGLLGLGVSSPSAGLHVEDDNGAIISRSGYSQYLQLQPANNSVPTILGVGGNGVHIGPTNSTGIRINNSGSVGIGTATPAFSRTGGGLRIDNSDAPHIRLDNGSSNVSEIYQSGVNTVIDSRSPSGVIKFTVQDSEKMRLDSGNLLVGGTSLGENGAVTMGGDGRIYAIRASDTACFFGRTGADGSIVNFTKDGSTAGSIGTFDSGANIYIGSGDTGVTFNPTVNGILPHNPSTNAQLDNAIDLGYPTYRFKDGYFSGTLNCVQIRGVSDTNTGIDVTGSDIIGFKTGGSERGRFNSAGALLIGKTSDSISNDGISLAGSATGGGHLSATNSGNPAFAVNRKSSDGSCVSFNRDGSIVGSVSVTSSGTTYNTTSDIRLKTDIEPIDHATDMLMAMNPVSHRWKADPDADAVVGFIAQEMQEIVPEAVSTGDDDDAMMSMDYGRITPVIVAALQDAHRKIEQLEQRLAEMETGNE